MYTRRRGGDEFDIIQNLRDYIVPIIILIIIIAGIISIFIGGDEIPVNNQENKIGFNISLDSNNTDGVVIYPGNHKKNISGISDLYKGEKLQVTKGSISLNLDTYGKLRLNKLGELKYKENGNIDLKSSDLWLKSITSTIVNMRFANINIGDNSVISFTQNEMGSTIYLLDGFAEVSNLAGESTILDKGQKITIDRLDANKIDLDLSLNKGELDDFFKNSDWFVLNNGKNFINIEKVDKVENGTGVTTNNKIINLTNVFDDSNVSTDTINIAGNFKDDNITKIVVNGFSANIDKKLKTFIFENIELNNRENDLVFKVYDDANDLLSKFVYTIYFEGAKKKDNTIGAFQVKTYNVDANNFKFTSPNTKNLYTSYGEFITIKGNVIQEGIKEVHVNGYKLKSFRGSTWRYHASTYNNNFNYGTNVYEIKYYGDNNKLVFINYYTIVRKEVTLKKQQENKKIEDSKIEENKKYSNEVEIK